MTEQKLQAKDLRIDNLVTINNEKSWPHLKGKRLRVVGVRELTQTLIIVAFPLSKYSVTVADEHGNEYNQLDQFIEPIKLTEEVLPKLGFKEIGQAWTNGFIELSYIVSDDYFQCEIRFPFSEWVIIPIKWVHTLQNITRYLAVEEITYTES